MRYLLWDLYLGDGVTVTVEFQDVIPDRPGAEVTAKVRQVKREVIERG